MPATEEYVHKQFEGFQLTTELSTNAASHTFLAERISSSTQKDNVIVKWFYATPFTTPLKKKYFLQSALLLKQLHHPHIMPFLSAGIDAETNTPYTITTYASGNSLFERLQQQDGPPFSMEEVWQIIAQVGQALAYAHLNNIIHGNLKPHNIFFVARDEVRVTDFFLMLPFSSAQWAINTSHEQHYTAPELRAGGLSKDGDQYALASIAYELLTGRKPFETPSVNAPGTFYKTRTLISPQRLNPDISDEVEDAILKALSREPLERYANIRHFLRDLGVSLETTQHTAAITLATEIVSPSQTPPLHTRQQNSQLVEPPLPDFLQDVVLITPDAEPDPEAFSEVYADEPFSFEESPEITSDMLATTPIFSEETTEPSNDMPIAPYDTVEALAPSSQEAMPAAELPVTGEELSEQETVAMSPATAQELSEQATEAILQPTVTPPPDAEDLPTEAIALPLTGTQQEPVGYVTTAERVQKARLMRDGIVTHKNSRLSALAVFALITLAIVLVGVLLGIFLPAHLQQASTKSTATPTTAQHMNITTKVQTIATSTTAAPSPQPTPSTAPTATPVATQPATATPHPTSPPPTTAPVFVPAPPPPPTATPTPTQTSATATPTIATGTNFMVMPQQLDANNCTHPDNQERYLACTVTLSLGSSAPGTVRWYAYPSGMAALLSNYNGSLDPGQSQQVTISLLNQCSNHNAIVFNANQTSINIKLPC